MMILTQLEKFRQGIYDSLGKARDAVFELMDAVLTSPSITSFLKFLFVAAVRVFSLRRV
jgi:hypothetical protein